MFGFTRIDEGHAALLTRWGRPVRDAVGAARRLGPGLHWHLPGDRVHVFSVMERTIDLGGSDGTLEALTRDGTLVRLRPRLRFRYDAERAEAFLFGIDRSEDHLRELFKALVRNEIAHFGPEGHALGSYALLRSDRRQLSDRLATLGREELGPKYGIVFLAVDFEEIDPPTELADALNAVQSARAQAEAALRRAEADEERRVLAAREGIAIAHDRARAVELEALGLAAALERLDEEGSLESYVQRRRDEVFGRAGSIFERTG